MKLESELEIVITRSFQNNNAEYTESYSFKDAPDDSGIELVEYCICDDIRCSCLKSNTIEKNFIWAMPYNDALPQQVSWKKIKHVEIPDEVWKKAREERGYVIKRYD